MGRRRRETGRERKRGAERRKEEKKSGRLCRGPTGLGPRSFSVHPTRSRRCSVLVRCRCNGIGNALRFVEIRSRLSRSLARSCSRLKMPSDRTLRSLRTRSTAGRECSRNDWETAISVAREINVGRNASATAPTFKITYRYYERALYMSLPPPLLNATVVSLITPLPRALQFNKLFFHWNYVRHATP